MQFLEIQKNGKLKKKGEMLKMIKRSNERGRFKKKMRTWKVR